MILEHILDIETKRCRIRQFKQSDVDELYLILSNPKVMEYIEAPFTLEDTKDFLNKNALSYPSRVFALEYKQNKKLIGHVIFHEYDEESYEIGFILSQDYWRQGIADEITKSLIDYVKNKNIHSGCLFVFAEYYSGHSLPTPSTCYPVPQK